MSKDFDPYVVSIWESFPQVADIFDKPSWWLLAGTGVTFQLLLSSAQSLESVINTIMIALGIFVLIASACCGVYAKFLHTKSEMIKVFQGITEEKAKEHFEKIEEEARDLGDYDPMYILKKYTSIFPEWIVSRFFKEAQLNELLEPEITAKRAARTVIDQSIFTAAQFALYLIFVICLWFGYVIGPSVI